MSENREHFEKALQGVKEEEVAEEVSMTPPATV
jgi:hypothetical protein